MSFVTAGTALVGLSGPFKILGLLLIVVGMGIILATIWPFVRLFLLTHIFHRYRRSPLSRLSTRYRRLAGIGFVTLLLSASGGIMIWPQPPGDLREGCDQVISECVLVAAELSPGEPLVFALGDLEAGQSHHGVLTVDARLEGTTEGRYVAIACRNNDVGEYVLAVWPDAVSFELIEWDEGGKKVIEGGRWPGTIHSGERFNRLELRCVGTEIGATINGVPVTIDPDNLPNVQHLTGGWYIASGIGVAEVLPPGPVSARFANLYLNAVTSDSLATPQP